MNREVKFAFFIALGIATSQCAWALSAKQAEIMALANSGNTEGLLTKVTPEDLKEGKDAQDFGVLLTGTVMTHPELFRSEEERLSVVRSLVSKGLAINHVSEQSGYSRSVLDPIVKNWVNTGKAADKSSLIFLLNSGADLKASSLINKSHPNLAFVAAKKGQADLFEVLVTRGKIDLNEKDSNGHTLEEALRNRSKALGTQSNGDREMAAKIEEMLYVIKNIDKLKKEAEGPDSVAELNSVAIGAAMQTVQNPYQSYYPNNPYNNQPITFYEALSGRLIYLTRSSDYYGYQNSYQDSFGRKFIVQGDVVYSANPATIGGSGMVVAQSYAGRLNPSFQSAAVSLDRSTNRVDVTPALEASSGSKDGTATKAKE